MKLTAIQFCNAWNLARGKPFVDWTVAQASAVHEGTGNYGVLLRTSVEEPSYIAIDFQISPRGHFVTAHFLGKSRRNYATYYLDDQEFSSDLFLRSAMYYHPTQAPLPEKGHHNHDWRLRHVFTPDGKARTAYFNQSLDSKNHWSEWDFDADRHMFKLPPFGDYDSFCGNLNSVGWELDDAHGANAKTGHNKGADSTGFQPASRP